MGFGTWYLAISNIISSCSCKLKLLGYNGSSTEEDGSCMSIALQSCTPDNSHPYEPHNATTTPDSTSPWRVSRAHGIPHPAAMDRGSAEEGSWAAAQSDKSWREGPESKEDERFISPSSTRETQPRLSFQN